MIFKIKEINKNYIIFSGNFISDELYSHNFLSWYKIPLNIIGGVFLWKSLMLLKYYFII